MENGPTQIKNYEIGGKKYVQRPIVLGQLNMLTPLVADIPLRADISAGEIVTSLAEKLPGALAIVLIEDGKNLREAMDDKALRERVTDLAWSVDAETALEVISDFFGCNQVSGIFEKVTEKLSGLKPKLQAMVSSGQSSNSPEATSPGETASSGAPKLDTSPSGSGLEPEKSEKNSSGIS